MVSRHCQSSSARSNRVHDRRIFAIADVSYGMKESFRYDSLFSGAKRRAMMMAASPQARTVPTPTITVL